MQQQQSTPPPVPPSSSEATKLFRCFDLGLRHMPYLWGVVGSLGVVEGRQSWDMLRYTMSWLCFPAMGCGDG